MDAKLIQENFWTLVTAGVLVAILAIYTVCYTVPAGSVGVVKTFGAITHVKDAPGLGVKWPWPFQSFEAVDQRTRLLTVLGKEVLTRDEFNIICEVCVGWKISNAEQFLTRLRTAEEARKMLMSRAADARERVIKQTKLDRIINASPAQAEAFDAFEQGMLQALRDRLPGVEYGIDIEFLYVKRIAFPESVVETVFSLMQRERERIAKEYRTEGEKQANIIKSDAARRRDEMLADAEARAIILRGEGDAEAVKFYQIFNENPELANYVRELDAFRSTLKKSSTVVLPIDSVPFRALRASSQEMMKPTEQ